MDIRIALLLLTLIMQSIVVHAAQKDPRLKLFIEKYDALNGRTPLLGHTDSPFYPYHKLLFENGLDAAKLKSLRSAQKKGNCILVQKLMVTGFLGLFPFLKPAFDDTRYANLLFMIAKDRRPENGRCMDHRLLRELLTKTPLEELPPVDFTERGFGRSYNLLFPNVPRGTFHGFGERAFCDDYPPSIADLRAIANRPGGIVLTEQEGLYLLERARVHGLDKDDYRQTFVKFKNQFSPDANLSRLRAASRAHRLEDIDFKVEGYWQSECRSVRRYRLNKLRQ